MTIFPCFALATVLVAHGAQLSTGLANEVICHLIGCNKINKEMNHDSPFCALFQEVLSSGVTAAKCKVHEWVRLFLQSGEHHLVLLMWL